MRYSFINFALLVEEKDFRTELAQHGAIIDGYAIDTSQS